MVAPFTISVEGRRVYVTIPYGHPAKDDLQGALGLHWEKEKRAWWCSVQKKAELESLVNKYKNAPAGDEPKEVLDDLPVIATVTYKDRRYRAVWSGTTKDGRAKTRLVSVDGKISFWADTELVTIERTYERYERTYNGRTFLSKLKTVGQLREFAKNPQPRYYDDDDGWMEY